jgi:transposase-like protein
MGITLKDIIGLAKELPEEYFQETYEKLREVKEKADAEKEAKSASCPQCGSVSIVRNGKRNRRQAYICKDCGKTFVETSASATMYSHQGETVWKQVIRDTVEGVSIDKTAAGLDLAHSTVFNMRHKILFCIEKIIADNPAVLEGVCEADETYVLENVKGSKIPDGYHRKPRKHGAKASKPGISNEYICICTSVDSDNNCTAAIVNRAAPSKAEIEQVFGDKVCGETVILCDGSNRYDVLEDKCTVAHSKRVNRVNLFHSFIKERLRSARGVATVYLSRYSALFSKIFAKQESAVDEIWGLMTSRSSLFATISTVKDENLLII